MAEYNLGTARGKIELDADGVKRGVSEANREVDGFTGRLDKASGSLKKAGGAMIGMGAAVLAGVGVAVKASADFEKEISNFNAAAKESPEVLEQVRQKALQIGRDTSFGAGEAASAITNLSYAGLETTDILNGAADAAVALAEAGELEIPQAASIMSAAMNTFGIAAGDAGTVADNLIGVFANSDTMVNELGEALQQTGATAATLGLSLGDTTVALGLLADQGIKGGKAGTTLNRMLLSLQPSSKKAAGAMEELGLITEDGSNQFFDAEGNMKGLADVSQILQDSMQGLTKQQKLAYLETIFGSRALSAATALADAGAEGFNGLAESMGEVSAADVAADKLDNLSGAMTILKGTVETTLIGVGAPLQGMLQGVVEAVTGVLNSFASLPEHIQKFVTIGVVAAGVALVLAGGFLMMLGFLPAIIAGFSTLFTVIIPIVAPILAVVAAVALLAAGIYLLWQRSETFRDIVMGVWAQVQAAIQIAVDFILEIFNNLKFAWDVLVGLFRGNPISEVMATQMGTVGTILQNVVGIVKSATDAIVAIFKFFRDFVVDLWNRFGEHIISAAKNFLGFLVEFFDATWENIKQVIEAVLRVIKGIFDVFAGAFTGDWSRVWEGIKAIFSGIWSAIHAVFSQIVAAIILVAKTAWTALETGIGAAMAAISAIWDAAWNRIKMFFSSIWDSIKSAMSTYWTEIKREFQVALDTVKRLWNTAWEAVSGAFSRIWGGIASAISGAFDSVMSWIRGLKDNITGFFRNAGTWLKEAGKAIISGLVQGIRDAIGKVTGAIGDVMSAARRLLPSSPAEEGPFSGKGWTLYSGKSIVDGLAEGIEREEAAAVRAAYSVADSLAGAFSTPALAMAGATTSPVSSSRSEVYNFGDIVLPNITDRSSADDLIAGLRQAARRR